MRYLTAYVLLTALLLAGCSAKKPEPSLSREERVELYASAIETARDEQTNKTLPLITRSDDDAAEIAFDLLGVTPEDMNAYAVSVSRKNVSAYAIAAIYPSAGKDDTILENLRSFVSSQQQSFKEHQPDQYEIAVNTRLETLEDGTVLLVMSENQDAVFDAIRDRIERRK